MMSSRASSPNALSVCRIQGFPEILISSRWIPKLHCWFHNRSQVPLENFPGHMNGFVHKPFLLSGNVGFDTDNGLAED
jgi:hypothetical protein